MSFISLLILLTIPLLTSANPTCHDYFGNLISLSPNMVGDGYCDCYDTGEDEHSYTSACSHVNPHRFQCGAASPSSASTNSLVPPSFRGLQSIVHSRVNDTVCDCCDGSDEPAGDCPNTCETHYLQAVNYKKSALQVAVKGYAKYQQSVEEAEQKSNAMKAKLRALLDEEKATYELGNFVTLYKSNERAFASSPLPRYEYDIQGARLKASRGGKENISNELKNILSTKCPTWHFTLEVRMDAIHF